MPDIDGLEAARRILAEADDEHPVAILMLTTFDLNEYVYDALRAGASGFLLKDVLPSSSSPPCGSSPPATRSSRPTITKRLIEQFARAAPPRTPPPRLETLTRRELEILTLVARGLSNGRDRRRADPQPGHRQDPRQAHPGQARPARPRPRRRARLRGRPRHPRRLRQPGTEALGHTTHASNLT